MFMEPVEIYARLLKELADAGVQLLSMIFEDSWQSGEVPCHRKIVFIFKKGKKCLPWELLAYQLHLCPGRSWNRSSQELC